MAAVRSSTIRCLIGIRHPSCSESYDSPRDSWSTSPVAATEGILPGVPNPTRGEIIHRKLAGICLSFPRTTEVIAWGHPNFRVDGTTFAALEPYKGVLSIAVRASDTERELLLDDPRFFVTPYSGGKGWVSLNLEGRIQWSLVKDLCHRAYVNASEMKKSPKRKRREQG